jgi:hypothetical protein
VVFSKFPKIPEMHQSGHDLKLSWENSLISNLASRFEDDPRISLGPGHIRMVFQICNNSSHWPMYWWMCVFNSSNLLITNDSLGHLLLIRTRMIWSHIVGKFILARSCDSCLEIENNKVQTIKHLFKRKVTFEPGNDRNCVMNCFEHQRIHSLTGDNDGRSITWNHIQHNE